MQGLMPRSRHWNCSLPARAEYVEVWMGLPQGRRQGWKSGQTDCKAHAGISNYSTHTYVVK